MKQIFLTVLAFIVVIFSVVAQSTPQVPKNLDSLQNTVNKLMQFYESYDDGSPESLKKAKYNDAINELFGGAASEKDKDDAYPIIDAYIKGDKALEQDSEQKEGNDNDFDEAVGNTDEANAAMNYINQQVGALQNMSYSEFEKYVEKASPFVSKSDIKSAYNEMHKSDGKQVNISSKDAEMTEAQKQMWAFKVLNNPKNYEDFKKACKIMNPKFTDSEIRKAWENKD
jgi:hypothetical protein